MPRGGVLSCTLFIVRKKTIHSYIPRNAFYCTYIDDIQIGYKSCDLAKCEPQLQLGLINATKWADENRSTFNQQYSTFVLFMRKRGFHFDPIIYLRG